MAEVDTTQSRNTVQGDQAGRDINKPLTVNYRYDSDRPTEVTRLTEKFRQERASDEKFQATLEKLEHFSTPVMGERVVGLQPKLEAAGCASQLRFAQVTKELFTKKLLAFQLSESAQRMHALLLAEVYSRFHRCILPLIQEGASPLMVSQAVQAHIIDPIQQMLEENVLELYADEINGMLYFLTGNCHITWTKC